MLLAEGAPVWIAVPLALLFAVTFGGYILWASCRRERPSDRTGEYDG